MTITTEEALTLAESIRGASEIERAKAAAALRTLAAERDSLRKAVNSYTYIDKNGKSVLARTLEDERDAAISRAEKAEAEEKRLRDLVQEMVLSRSDAQGDYRARAERAEAEAEKLREALAPSGDTKAEYMGEFSFGFPVIDENGNDAWQIVYVPWTTIKEIMAAIRARAALNQGGDDADQQSR